MIRPKRPPKNKPPAQEEKPIDGILIQLGEEDGNGDREISISTLGGVKTTELPTLLGMARRVIEKQLGIGGG